MKERIQIAVDYELEYEGIQGREAAIEAALECGIDVSGAGPEGHFRTRRVKTRVSAPEGQTPGTDAKRQESLPEAVRQHRGGRITNA